LAVPAHNNTTHKSQMFATTRVPKTASDMPAVLPPRAHKAHRSRRPRGSTRRRACYRARYKCPSSRSGDQIDRSNGCTPSSASSAVAAIIYKSSTIGARCRLRRQKWAQIRRQPRRRANARRLLAARCQGRWNSHSTTGSTRGRNKLYERFGPTRRRLPA
jgi:hypothetical protein